MFYSESAANRSNNANGDGTDNKRTRDQDEQLQSLQFQQRSAAARALERLKKTEHLNPIDRLVLLFNMHFQRRDAPSYRIVSDSPLRILHPQYFEFISPFELISKYVPEDGLPELLIEIDKIVEAHKSILNNSSIRPPSSSSSGGEGGARAASSAKQTTKPLTAGNADGTVGWGEDEEEKKNEGEEEMTFSNLLGEDEDEDDDDGEEVVAGNEEEREEVVLEAFWSLLAECVEATQKYREVRDALGTTTTTSTNNGGGDIASNTSANNSSINPLLHIFSTMQIGGGGNSLLSGVSKSGGGPQSTSTAALGGQPTIDLTALGLVVAAPSAEERAIDAPSASGVLAVASLSPPPPSATTSSSSSPSPSLVRFFGYAPLLKEAATIVDSIPMSEMSTAQRYLTSLCALPTTTAPVGKAYGTSSSTPSLISVSNNTLSSSASPLQASLASFGMIGPQAHFIYRLAAADIAHRLARFHLESFARLYRKGRVAVVASAAGDTTTATIKQNEPADDTFAEARRDAETFMALVKGFYKTKEKGGGGEDVPLDSLQKMFLQWQYYQYQLAQIPSPPSSPQYQQQRQKLQQLLLSPATTRLPAFPPSLLSDTPLSTTTANTSFFSFTSIPPAAMAEAEGKPINSPLRQYHYVLPPITALAVAEADRIRQKRIELANQRGGYRGAGDGNGGDADNNFLREGFGADYIPSEEDFMRAMALHGSTAGAVEGADDGDEDAAALKAAAAAAAGGGPSAAGGSGIVDEGEALFNEEIHNYYISHLQKQLQQQQKSANAPAITPETLSQHLLTPDGKPRFIKPVRYCKVKTGYVWNAYNRAKYGGSNRSGEKPPQVVQWYEFVLFFPLIAHKIKNPKGLFRVETTEKGLDDEHRILVFSAGAPYADVAYKIVNEQWDKRPGGVRCSIDDKGKFRLFFRLASTNYRR